MSNECRKIFLSENKRALLSEGVYLLVLRPCATLVFWKRRDCSTPKDSVPKPVHDYRRTITQIVYKNYASGGHKKNTRAQILSYKPAQRPILLILIDGDLDRDKRWPPQVVVIS